MDVKQENDLAMEWVEKSGVSEQTKETMFSAVAWYIFKHDKEGYELIPKKRELKLGDLITRAELEQMLREKVVY